MLSSTTETGGGNQAAPAAAPGLRRPRHIGPTVSERLIELQRVGASLLPVWVRAPKDGPEHFTGFTRSKLYELAGAGHIRSVSVREPGQVKGTRLFHLASILEYVGRLEREAQEKSGEEG